MHIESIIVWMEWRRMQFEYISENSCPDAPTAPNAVVRVEIYNSECRAIYECDPGYMLGAGDLLRVMAENSGVWNGSQPSCYSKWPEVILQWKPLCVNLSAWSVCWWCKFILCSYCTSSPLPINDNRLFPWSTVMANSGVMGSELQYWQSVVNVTILTDLALTSHDFWIGFQDL